VTALVGHYDLRDGEWRQLVPQLRPVKARASMKSDEDGTRPHHLTVGDPLLAEHLDEQPNVSDVDQHG
jgi:hypothetical protein